MHMKECKVCGRRSITNIDCLCIFCFYKKNREDVDDESDFEG